MRATSIRGVFTFLALLLFVPAVAASGATFEIRGQGIVLGEPKEVHEDGKPLPPRFHARAEVGKPFTLTAQGMVLPRGGKPSPGEPEAGSWSVDEKHLKRLPMDKKGDKTIVGVRLEPTAPGLARVRFTGRILGYDHTFDVLVEVVGPRKP